MEARETLLAKSKMELENRERSTREERFRAWRGSTTRLDSGSVSKSAFRNRERSFRKGASECFEVARFGWTWESAFRNHRRRSASSSKSEIHG